MTWKGLPQHVLDTAGIVTANGVTEIPYRDRTGTRVATRYVKHDGRRWWNKGAKLIPYGLETLGAGRGLGRLQRPAPSVLLVVEGESDTLAVRATLSNTLGWHVIGCPGSSVWRPEWGLILERFRSVVVIGDGDQAGHSFMDSVQESYPAAVKVWLAEGEDVRSIVQERGSPELYYRVDMARQQRNAHDALLLARDVGEWQRILAG